MAIGDNSFVYNFEVVRDGRTIGAVTAKGSEISIWIFGSERTSCRLADIASVTLIHAEGASLAKGGSGAVVGALIAGPVGAIAGAAFGRLLRKCHFLLELANGRKFLCKGLAKIFDDFEGHRKIIALAAPDTKKIEAIAARTMPALPSLAPQSKPTAITIPVRTVHAPTVLVISKNTAAGK